MAMSQTPPPGPPPVYPPYASPGVATAQRRNGPALASLILGILGCVPVLTGLLAMILGFVGLRRTRDPRVGGKGMAIAGLVLGLLSLLGWTVFGGGVIALLVGTAPQRDLAKQFIRDVAAGRIDAALAVSTPDVKRADCEEFFQGMKTFGSLNDITISNISLNTANGVTTARLAGTATFTQGSPTFEIGLIKLNGQWKIRGMSVDASKMGSK
jgi:hypothetical protein